MPLVARRPRQQYTLSEWETVRVARTMERVCRRQLFGSRAELLADLADPASEFRSLAIFVLELRLSQRCRYWWILVVEHLEAPQTAHPRWFEMFVDDCWGFYSFVRRRAVPRGEQPQFEPADRKSVV